MEDVHRKFLHDMANKLQSMEGKINRIGKKIPEEGQEDLEKLRRYCEEAKARLHEYRGTLFPVQLKKKA